MAEEAPTGSAGASSPSSPPTKGFGWVPKWTTKKFLEANADQMYVLVQKNKRVAKSTFRYHVQNTKIFRGLPSGLAVPKLRSFGDVVPCPGHRPKLLTVLPLRMMSSEEFNFVTAILVIDTIKMILAYNHDQRKGQDQRPVDVSASFIWKILSNECNSPDEIHPFNRLQIRFREFALDMNENDTNPYIKLPDDRIHRDTGFVSLLDGTPNSEREGRKDFPKDYQSPSARKAALLDHKKQKTMKTIDERWREVQKSLYYTAWQKPGSLPAARRKHERLTFWEKAEAGDLPRALQMTFAQFLDLLYRYNEKLWTVGRLHAHDPPEVRGMSNLAVPADPSKCNVFIRLEADLDDFKKFERAKNEWIHMRFPTDFDTNGNVFMHSNAFIQRDEALHGPAQQTKGAREAAEGTDRFAYWNEVLQNRAAWRKKMEATAPKPMHPDFRMNRAGDGGRGFTRKTEDLEEKGIRLLMRDQTYAYGALSQYPVMNVDLNFQNIDDDDDPLAGSLQPAAGNSAEATARNAWASVGILPPGPRPAAAAQQRQPQPGLSRKRNRKERSETGPRSPVREGVQAEIVDVEDDHLHSVRSSNSGRGEEEVMGVGHESSMVAEGGEISLPGPSANGHRRGGVRLRDRDLVAMEMEGDRGDSEMSGVGGLAAAIGAEVGFGHRGEEVDGVRFVGGLGGRAVGLLGNRDGGLVGGRAGEGEAERGSEEMEDVGEGREVTAVNGAVSLLNGVAGENGGFSSFSPSHPGLGSFGGENGFVSVVPREILGEGEGGSLSGGERLKKEASDETADTRDGGGGGMEMKVEEVYIGVVAIDDSDLDSDSDDDSPQGGEEQESERASPEELPPQPLPASLLQPEGGSQVAAPEGEGLLPSSTSLDKRKRSGEGEGPEQVPAENGDVPLASAAVGQPGPIADPGGDAAPPSQDPALQRPSPEPNTNGRAPSDHMMQGEEQTEDNSASSAHPPVAQNYLSSASGGNFFPSPPPGMPPLPPPGFALPAQSSQQQQQLFPPDGAAASSQVQVPPGYSATVMPDGQVHYHPVTFTFGRPGDPPGVTGPAQALALMQNFFPHAQGVQQHSVEDDSRLDIPLDDDLEMGQVCAKCARWQAEGKIMSGRCPHTGWECDRIKF